MKLNLRYKVTEIMELARELEYLINHSHYHSSHELDCVLSEIETAKEKLLLDLKDLQELISQI